MTTTISFIDGGAVTSPQGFSAGATYAGLKTFAEDKLDLGIIASDSPCTAAGVFTTSTIKSPTVSVNQTQNGFLFFHQSYHYSKLTCSVYKIRRSI